jgi:UDP-2,4-diacetamido-2,4,6-trideoxy-beta-L-altropyranose hydrolase
MTLDAIEGLQTPVIHVDVVVGIGNPYREALKKRCESMKNVTCHVQINNMAEFMRKADLAIGAAGTSTWERCALSLPALVVSIASNQQPIAEAIAAAGAATYLGKAENIDSSSIRHALLDACQHPELLQNQGRISAVMVDAMGAERVARTMASL